MHHDTFRQMKEPVIGFDVALLIAFSAAETHPQHTAPPDRGGAGGLRCAHSKRSATVTPAELQGRLWTGAKME